MRSLMIATALLAVSACNRGGSANNSAGNTANGANAAAAPAKAGNSSNSATAAPAAAAPTQTAAAMPENFPGDDLLTRGSECIVYMGHSREAKSKAPGIDDANMAQAQDQWEAALKADPEAEGWQQMLASSVNVLASVPPAQRDAASRWCVENAPEVDPEG
jgi:hypothetical protein